MTTAPLVTVLMPVFNGARYLAKALESVKGQTYTNLEILLINDGSTDDSGEMIELFAQNEQRAVVINKRNTGLVHTLNIGLDAANGRWIARLDSDDIAHPRRIERQVTSASHARGIVLVGSDFSTFSEETGKIKRYRLPSDHDNLVKRLRRLQNFFPHSAAMFDADAVRGLGGYDMSAIYNEDWDLWLRLSECGRMMSVREDLVTIRKHRDQVTRNSGNVSPPGEAFVSTVIYLSRRYDESQSHCHRMESEELRALIRGTDEYRKFCELSVIHQQIGSELAASRALCFKLIRLLSQFMREPRVFSALQYSLRGTKLATKFAKSKRSD